MKLFQDKKYKTTLLHIGVWAFLFIFPLIMNDNVTLNNLLRRKWLPLILSGAIFYINYFHLIPRFYFSRKNGWFIVLNLFLIALSLVVTVLIFNFLKQDFVARTGEPKVFKWSFEKLIRYKHTISFFLAVGAAVAIRITKKWKEEEDIRKLAENEHLKSEIMSLKYQLQPHFFFNTLNNIYSLIDTQPEQAKTTIHKLAKLMRYMLYKTNDTKIALNKEVEFIQAYVEVMRTRYGNHLTIETKYPAITNLVHVPPLLFISLVENAFKHGIDATLPSFININMVLEKNKLVFTLENSNFPKDGSDESGSGIGLNNLIKRLAFLYPQGDYLFHQEKRDNSYFTQLTIPLSHA